MPRNTQMNALLVIKDPLLLDAIAQMLEHLQNQYVFRTSESRKALELIPRIDIGILIASLNMIPNGAEPIVEAARQKSPNLPVLLIAGSCDINDLKRVAAMRAAFWQTGTSGEGLFEGIERARDTAPTPATAT